jgi:type I restriction enzyme, S subunit
MSFDLPQLPQGWAFTPLESCAVPGSISYGVVQPGSPVVQGVSIIRVNNFKDMRLDLSDVMRIAPEVEAKYRRTRLSGGEVLLALVGSVGQVAEVPMTCAGFNVARAVGVVKPANGIDAKWIAICLRSPLSQHLLGSRANTTVQTTINLKDVRALPIPIPPLAERLQIADFISALDDRIALLRETNATLEAIAQALFKSWFVDFDPVRAKQQGLAPVGMDEATATLFPDSFEESALGLAPKGWECIDLAGLTKRFEGGIQTGPFGSQLHASDYVESGVPVVMPKDIVNRRASTDTVAQIGAADADRLSRHKLKAGDIVFSRRGDVERHALITDREVGWLCGTGCLLLRPGRQWKSPGFLSMLLDAPRARTWLVQHAVGATMPNLNTGILGSVPVVLPSPSVLGAFEELVSVTEQQRSRNASLAETLATLRDTLLPRLISGQLRLPQPAAATLETTPA